MCLVTPLKLFLIFATAILLGFSAMMRAQEQRSQQAITSNDVADLSPGQMIIAYEKGEPTIKARAAPLLEVLRQVCKRVGAKIEAPLGGSEPISVDLGPGPARDVLTSLLMGSRFNYVMQAADDPRVLARVILFSASDFHEASSSEPVLEANSVGDPPPIEEQVDPRESAQEMKDLLADAKRDIAMFDSDTDPSVRDSATKMIGMLESSIATLSASPPQAAQTDDEPSPPPPREGDTRTGRPIRHRRR
jgi:hypothetical protein